MVKDDIQEARRLSAIKSYLNKEKDPLLDEAIKYIIIYKQISSSTLQRKFSIGFSRAARMIDQMEIVGVVGPADGSKPRDVLISSYDDYQKEKYEEQNIFNTPISKLHLHLDRLYGLMIKSFFVWLCTLGIFYFLSLYVEFNKNNLFIIFVLLLDVGLGICAFMVLFCVMSVLLFNVLKISLQHLKIKNIYAFSSRNKWFILAVLAIIIFAIIIQKNINQQQEVINQQRFHPTKMDCLKLGSDNARASCIRRYKPVD